MKNIANPRPRESRLRAGCAARASGPPAALRLFLSLIATATLLTRAAATPDATTVTFNRHIAPIIFRNCSGCHRPGETGPFDLLNYADVQRRVRQIVEVTGSRFMPPWLPEDGHEPFLDTRRLTPTEIALIRDWYAGGAVEGDPANLPPLPRWTEGWQLGPPDLVVTVGEPFELPAEGRDVYRNFVVAIPTAQRRWVRAFEFRPGSRAVHHAFLRLDASGESRRRDEREPGPGFAGMDVPPSAESPAGHFLSWQPGRLPSWLPDGLAWTLPPRVDLVLLAHLQPIGRVEPVRPSVGFYFTDVPPTNLPTKLGLRSYKLDIPAGATNEVFEESVTLPVDTELIAVLPHAHYLARRMEGYARLPDGSRRVLLRIPDWDFNWQSDFRFARPVSLPRGTTLGFSYGYDNSTNNVRNPHHPPRRVKFGLRTTDEMGELWFQVVASRPEDRETLERVAGSLNLRALAELSQFRLRENPEDAEAITELAKIRLSSGDAVGAMGQLLQALKLRPDLADAHYHVGLILMQERNYRLAEGEFLETLRLEPGHYQARANAGLCCLQQRRLDEAEVHFQEVLRVHPTDSVARANLERIARARKSSTGGLGPAR